MTSHVKIPNLKPAGPQGSDILAAERAKATFNVKDMSLYLYGSRFLDTLQRMLEIIEKEPLFDKSDMYFMGRNESFKRALAMDKKLALLAKEHKWDSEEWTIIVALSDCSGPFSVHRSMFVPVIMQLGTEKQIEKFGKPGLNYEIIGCYAQTELGHGSNVQGLETTATYIPETNEFEIHSPSLTASKWWIGNLGATANHAVVMARLISNGKDYGVHPFVVQVRDMKTHEPLPGITVGDIGPKFGFNTVDNGFVLFDHVRIPHFNMLSKFSRIVPGAGEYVAPPNAKLSYDTMVMVRTSIIIASRLALARAATIAIRYSAIRRQFVDKENPSKLPDGRIVETSVLDYTIQQYRLFPALAASYAISFTAGKMTRLYEENQKKRSQGDFSLMADLHASSSGLKSLTTTMAVDAIEECRRACGGHGYSSFSGFTKFYQDFLPNITWEGDNYILTQQTARYLFKNYRQLVRSKDSASNFSNPTIDYLKQYMNNPNQICTATKPSDFNNPELQLAAFGHRSAHLIGTAVDLIDNHKRSWNSMLVQISKISRAHCQFVLVKNFINAIYPNSDTKENKKFEFLETKPALRNVLITVCNLFTLHMMEQELGDFLSSGYLTPAQSQMINVQVLKLLNEIRPNAIALVDALHLPDYYLNSALGRHDGRVYETMLEWAAREPLNSVIIDNNIHSDRFLKEGQDENTLKAKL